MLNCLVTGATGFLGRHLVGVLLEKGASVCAYVRHDSETRHLVRQGVTLVTGDESSHEAMRRAVAGVDTVFHVAAYLPADAPFVAGGPDDAPGSEWERYQAVNVDFTEALLSASKAAGNGRFVFVSSNSVYGPDVPVPTSEDATLEPISAYGRSKLLAEIAVCKYQARGLDTTIIRPSLIYGPGDRTFTPLALHLARLPILPLINGGKSLLDLVYVRDVANLIWLAASQPRAAGSVYNAGPGEPTSLFDLVQAYRQVSGKGPRIFPVRPELAKQTSWLASWLIGPFISGARAALSPQGIALMNRDLHLSMVRAASELDFTPGYSLRKGLQETLAGEAFRS